MSAYVSTFSVCDPPGVTQVRASWASSFALLVAGGGLDEVPPPGVEPGVEPDAGLAVPADDAPGFGDSLDVDDVDAELDGDAVPDGNPALGVPLALGEPPDEHPHASRVAAISIATVVRTVTRPSESP
jgi:hypothetical protein